MSIYIIVIVNVVLFCHGVNALSTPPFDCNHCTTANYQNPNYRPQDCAKHCSSVSFDSKEDDNDDNDLHHLKHQINQIAVMTAILLVLVILMMLLLVYFIIRNSDLSKSFFKTWKSCWNKSNDNMGKQDHKMELTQVTAHKASNAIKLPVKSEQQNEIFVNKKICRKPSESISPDDSEAVEVDGYDNLGMSRSTINTHSRCSSPSSPTSNNGASCATIDTTMTTINLHS